MKNKRPLLGLPGEPVIWVDPGPTKELRRQRRDKERREKEKAKKGSK